MTLPFGDCLNINGELNRAGNKHPSKRALTKGWIAQATARTSESFLGVANFKNQLPIGFAFTQHFQKRSQLRVDWDSEACACLVPKGDDLLHVKINVRTRKRPSLSLS